MTNSFTFLSTDTGYYSGDTYNLIYSNPEDAIFKLKSLLKTVGWSVVANGSGSTYSTSSDIFTTTGSLFANSTWFAIKAPASDRTLVFQRSSAAGAATTNLWRIKYSPGGYNTATGTATRCPAPTNLNDEMVVLAQLGTDAVPTFDTLFVSPSTAGQFLNIGADNSGSFWLTVFAGGSLRTGCNGALIHEELLSGSYNGSDIDPWVTYAGAKIQSATIAVNTVLTYDVYSTGESDAASHGDARDSRNAKWFTTIRRTASKYGVNSFYGSIAGQVYSSYFVTSNVYRSTYSVVLPNNPYDYSNDLAPIPFIRAPISVGYPIFGILGAGTDLYGWKGFSKNIRYLGQTLATGDVLTVNTTGDYICMGQLALPWNGQAAVAK